MSKSAFKRNGFATVLAVVLIGMVAVALSAIAVVMRVEFRQSIAATNDVQIRQLLLASGPYVKSMLQQPIPGELQPPLPAVLKRDGARLSISLAMVGTDVDVTVKAVCGEFSRSQVQHFSNDGGGWRLRETTLLPLQRLRG